MKKSLLGCVVFGMFIIHPIYAQTAVIDSAAILKIGEEIEQLEKQFDELTKQTTSLQDSYSAISGYRGFGDKFKTESFQDNLPDSWESTYEHIRENGYEGLTPEAKAIYDKNKIYDKCQSIVATDQKKICEAQSVKAAQDQAFALEVLKRNQDRMDNIGKLLDSVKETKDPKGIAELQARIAAEQSLIANDQAKLQMFKMASEAEDKALDERQKEIDARMWASRIID